MSERPPQARVDEYFADQSGFWADVYAGDDVYSVIHQQRLGIALGWVDGLEYGAGARALDAGCGAGFLSVALAEKGFDVHATDSSPEMTEAAERNAVQAAVNDRVVVERADVQALPYGDESFDLVAALGVLPWVPAPAAALAELARVVRRGGHLIVNVDNAARLGRLLDPKWNPRLAPVKQTVKRVLRRRSEHGVPASWHSRSELDALLHSTGLEKVAGRTFGFGPFTLMGRPVLGRQASVAAHRRLQALADGRVPALGATGAQYIVLAQRHG